MGCNLSTGQLAIGLSDNLQCSAADGTKVIVLNHTGGPITVVDDNIAHLLGFTLNEIVNVTKPHVTEIGIGTSTQVTLTFKGHANVVDPELTVTITCNLDQTNKNILFSGSITKSNNTGSNEPISLQLPQVTNSTKANIKTDIVSKLSTSFTFNNVQTGNYTYSLNEIKFKPMSTEHFISNDSSTLSQQNYIMLFIITIVAAMILYYFHNKK